ncbi:homeobox protein rough sheath 1 [Mercurialis annua]|uniref:homeobox protein rough sheath 1 n=1 Tax=Mercurialis annua TaxID=3986 RepID=UPI00215DF0D1|nr:homeobox protein rough sheath 1 [Mercurialis annua]
MENTYSKEIQVEEEDEAEVLKKRISSHPLYDLLVQTHMDCLKIGGIGDADENDGSIKQKLPNKKPNSSSMSQPELDHFMEAYCLALKKLKVAMEEPQHETIGFINNMHLQLNYLQSTDSSSGGREN